MKRILSAWRDHGTKAIGFAQGTVAALCAVAGIIPEAHLKYWLAASAVLTFWRGFFNTQQNTPDLAQKFREAVSGDEEGEDA